MTEKTYAYIIRLIFILNAVFLTWAILWKCGVPFVGDGSQRMIQLIPFRGNTRWEMHFNVLLFISFGFLLSALIPKGVCWKFLAVISVSLFMEIAQYVFAVGRSDTTDVLLNSLGGVIGIGVYYLMAKLFGKHRRIVIISAGALIAAFEIYMSVSFILFGAVRFGFMMFKI